MIYKSFIKIIITFTCFFSTLSVHAQYDDVNKGDIIEINGVKAIVFTLDDEGHGTAMTIKAFRGQNDAWCTDKKMINSLKMMSLMDGYANTQEVFNYCSSQNVSLKKFPVFYWCNQLGEGWYIPAENQLKDFINFWLGNEQEFNWDDDDDETGLDLNAKTPKQINEKIMDAGGTPFFTGVYSSTMNDEKKLTVYWYNENKGTWRFRIVRPHSIKKYMSGRACYDF